MLVALATLVGGSAGVFAGEREPWEREVFFGEQHLHSEMSPDAYAVGTRQKMALRQPSRS